MTNTDRIILTEPQLEALKMSIETDCKTYLVEKVAQKQLIPNHRYRPLAELTLDQLLRVFYEPNSYELGPVFKEGDWVVGKCSNCLYELKRETVEDRTSEYKRFKVEHLSGGNFKQVSITTDNVRHATPEEIKAEKERQMWAKIGRKVGEFKLGDVVLNRNDTAIRVSNIDGAKRNYEEGNRKGFFPVESFINYEEEMK